MALIGEHGARLTDQPHLSSGPIHYLEPNPPTPKDKCAMLRCRQCKNRKTRYFRPLCPDIRTLRTSMFQGFSPEKMIIYVIRKMLWSISLLIYPRLCLICFLVVYFAFLIGHISFFCIIIKCPVYWMVVWEIKVLKIPQRLVYWHLSNWYQTDTECHNKLLGI